jgi:shikimate dehydrogenase
MQTAVIGHPISHSLSPLLHNKIFENEGIDAELRAYDVTDVPAFVEKIRTTPIHLTAVTLPHKQTIMPLLDEIDPVAKEIGAVNTVINRDGKLIGYNTDIVGIAQALKNFDLKGKNVLIVGSGGAAQPLAHHLKSAVAHIFCHSREFDKAKELCTRYGGEAIEASDEFKKFSFDVVVNATPLGWKKSDALPFSPDLIRKGMVVFDLNYLPTQFLKEANAQGATTISGLSMFLAQGLEQERLWLEREIPDREYTALLLGELEKREKEQH